MEINETKITKLEVRSWLYDCHFSCGREIYESPECVHEALHLCASDSYGRTWILKGFAPEAEVEVDRKITQIEAHLYLGGTLNPDCWVEDQPIYGSDAYIDFEREELAPVSQALASGHLHERDIPDSLKAYY